MQRALIQYRNPKNYYLVREALLTAHREDLIGSGPKCLIRAVPPRPEKTSAPPPKTTPRGKAPAHTGKSVAPSRSKSPASKPAAKPTAKPAAKRPKRK